MFSPIWFIISPILAGFVVWIVTKKSMQTHAQHQLDKAENRIVELEKSAQKLDSEFNQKITEAEKTVSQLEGQIDGSERAFSQMEEQLSKAAADFDKLRDQLSTEQQLRIKAETELKDTVNRLEEEKKLLDNAKEKLTQTFKALASDTLLQSNKTFLDLAKESYSKLMKETKGELNTQQEKVGNLVQPIMDTLKQFDENVKEIESSRKEAYGGLKAQIKNLIDSEQKLQSETGNLVTALRTPQVRGRWGELTLKRVVELAAMTDHCDFTEQVSVMGDEGILRPDLVVHLPGNLDIVVDSKVPLDAYLSSTSAESEDEIKSHLKSHSRQVRTHMKQLSAKAYWNQFKNTPEMVVMFIPGEPFLAAAADYDHKLIEDGMSNKVVLATPTTLIAMLKAVAFGWRQQKIEKHAQELTELGKTLYERMSILATHLSNIGKGLTKVNDIYNKAVRSYETRVLPSARKFKDLETVPGKEIKILEPVVSHPREVSKSD